MSMPRTRIFRLFKDLGIRVEMEDIGERTFTDPYWTGSSLLTSPDTETNVLFHELGHWLVTSPRRRALPNYGLGVFGYYSTKLVLESPRIVSHQFAEKEEQRADLFAITLEYYCRGDWKGTWKHHGWDKDLWLAISVLEKLRRNGLLDDMKPTVLDKEKWAMRNDVRLKRATSQATLGVVADVGPAPDF